MPEAKSVLITGAAGFVGFHLARNLLEAGIDVIGYDGVTPYYDIALKRARLAILEEFERFTFVEAMLEDADRVMGLFRERRPDTVVHLAAQAGVRYSLDNPRSYIDANIIGTFNLLEACRNQPVAHLLIASSSSVYGANTRLPFGENDKADTPVSLYAASKRANEHMAHSYAHLFGIPTTCLRLFTVYGPWGRPDLAFFKFVRAALKGEAIDVYNHGNMSRDFTYVDDLVRAIRLLSDCVPEAPGARRGSIVGDSLSPVAPFRVVNIGNGTSVPLMDFITTIEDCLGMNIRKNAMDMQIGDVTVTWANCGLLERLTGFRPSTPISAGMPRFIDWYRKYYGM